MLVRHGFMDLLAHAHHSTLTYATHLLSSLATSPLHSLRVALVLDRAVAARFAAAAADNPQVIPVVDRDILSLEHVFRSNHHDRRSPPIRHLAECSHRLARVVNEPHQSPKVLGVDGNANGALAFAS
ncbi:hypothetical protein ON010_g8427 [Phytophthora cinnamomi]|nr:hypothetical protein ON010_g8427 [Phytophthora cinnamomi]